RDPQRDGDTIAIEPRLHAVRQRARVEAAVRATIFPHRRVEIVHAPGWNRLVVELAFPGFEGEAAIEIARQHFLTQDRLRRGPAYPYFAARMLRRTVDAFRRHFGLEDLAHGHGLAPQRGAPPIELRRVE